MSPIATGSVKTTWIGHREQLGLARRHPFARGRALAFGAVPIAAAVVGDHCMGAVLAACHMAAEGCCAAALDGAHHLELVEGHVAAVGVMRSRPGNIHTGGRAMRHQSRNSSNSCGDSMAKRSLRPLPCSTRSIMRLESMSQTFSATTSMA